MEESLSTRNCQASVSPSVSGDDSHLPGSVRSRSQNAGKCFAYSRCSMCLALCWRRGSGRGHRVPRGLVGGGGRHAARISPHEVETEGESRVEGESCPCGLLCVGPWRAPGAAVTAALPQADVLSLRPLCGGGARGRGEEAACPHLTPGERRPGKPSGRPWRRAQARGRRRGEGSGGTRQRAGPAWTTAPAVTAGQAEPEGGGEWRLAPTPAHEGLSCAASRAACEHEKSVFQKCRSGG